MPLNLTGIKSELKKKKNGKIEGELHLSMEDQQLIQHIRTETWNLNVNNTTRTKAYLDFYRFYPEIEWALLGHIVSRNGGWNMTDLKGDLHSKLMNENTKQSFFSFLERGNWLIFQDAYPQFLLYAESMKRNQNLFFLLPHFNVSIFMEVIWNYYWEKRDGYTLAIALVINEQSYLEKRVVQNPVYKEKVFNTLEFVLQDLLSLNHVLFPFKEKDKVALAGLTLHHFGSLHERIMLGKRLYSLLFDNRTRLEKVYRWASANPHTGSRKDYWPDIFNDVNEGVPGEGFTRRLKHCRLRKGALRLYSPELEYAWKNVEHPAAEVGDWFNHWNVIEYLKEEKASTNVEIVGEYCETLENLELAAIAKKTIFL